MSEPQNDIQRVEVVDSMPAATVIKLFVAGTSVVLLAMISVFAFFVYSEAKARNDLIYKQCVQGELRDAVIVSILRTIPKERRPPVIRDAITTLEPPDETPCFTPSKWWPW